MEGGLRPSSLTPPPLIRFRHQRQVTSACVVKSSYGLAGVYILGDIAYNGYTELHEDAACVWLTVAHSTVYQGLASLLIPYVVIHNAVRGGGVGGGVST